MILERHGVNRLRIERGDDGFLADIAKRSDFGTLRLGKWVFAAAEEYVRLDAERCQLLDTMLGRLGFQFPSRGNIGHQCDMDEHRLVTPEIVAHLSDRFDKGQRLDITHGPANFAQDEIKAVNVGQREFLDRVGDVRNDLHRRAEIISAPLLRDNALIDATRGDIVRLFRGNAGKAFIMAEIQIGLRPIVGHIDFAVLIRRHRSGIDVQIGIKFANTDSVAARLKECRKRRRHQTFAKRGNHAAGNENEPRHGRRGLSRSYRIRQEEESPYAQIYCGVVGAVLAGAGSDLGVPETIGGRVTGFGSGFGAD